MNIKTEAKKWLQKNQISEAHLESLCFLIDDFVNASYEGKCVGYDPEYDPEFGDNVLCKCGHVYYRHFDPYEDMDPVGCKYCSHWHDKHIYEKCCPRFEKLEESEEK